MRLFNLNSALASTRVYAGTSSRSESSHAPERRAQVYARTQCERRTGLPLIFGRAPHRLRRRRSRLPGSDWSSGEVGNTSFRAPSAERIPAGVELDAADPGTEHVSSITPASYVRRRRRQLDSRRERLGCREVVIRSAEEGRFERGGRSQPDAMPDFELHQPFRAEVWVPLRGQEDRQDLPRLYTKVELDVAIGIGWRAARARGCCPQALARRGFQITRADGSTPQPPNVSYSSFEPSVRATPWRTEISSWRNVLNVSICFGAHLRGDGVVDVHVDVAIPAADHETVARTDPRFGTACRCRWRLR